MKKNIIFLLTVLMMAACQTRTETSETTDPTHDELVAWRGSHFGMFVHFGIYSELGGIWKGEPIPYYAEQIMNHARIPTEEYEAIAQQFNPTEWNADSVVLLAKAAGMKYIVFTTKHHDGFCMFKTSTTDYNIVDYTPFGRDVVKELAEACQRHDMRLGFYFSLPDWHHPAGIPRMAPDTTTNCTQFVNQVYSPLEIISPELEEVIVQQLTELLTNYGDIETIWFDMGLPTPEQSQRFRKTVKDLQPKCLVSGRIMNHCDDYLTLPDNGDVVGYTDVFWDNPASLYGSWGYKSWIQRPDVETQVNRQLDRLFGTVSHGGVFLLNIGPKGDGSILPYEKEVLTQIGAFLDSHPDTLDKIQIVVPEEVLVEESAEGFVLTNENGLTHAAFDAETYMTTEADSWRSWKIGVKRNGTYDIFIEYLPKNAAKRYIFRCGEQEINHLLPGVDEMLQTSYVGQMTLMEGEHEFILDQAERHSTLEPLGFELKRIIIKSRRDVACNVF